MRSGGWVRVHKELVSPCFSNLNFSCSFYQRFYWSLEIGGRFYCIAVTNFMKVALDLGVGSY